MRAVIHANVKHARMGVISSGQLCQGQPPLIPPPLLSPPPPSPPTTDDGVLPAGDAVNFISIVGSVNIGGLSTLSTLPSASQFSSNYIARQPI